MKVLPTILMGTALSALGLIKIDRAEAISFRFTNFTPPDGEVFEVSNSFSYTKKRVTVTATGGSTGDSSLLVNRSQSLGLGIGDPNEPNTTPTIDGNQGINTDEVLFLTFNTDVRVKKIFFSAVGTQDNYSLFFDDNLVIENSSFPRNGTPSIRLSRVFLDNPSTNQIGIAALEEGDEFFVTGVKVAKVAAVPVPPTILGAGIALGFGVFFKKQLKKQR